MRSHWVLLIVCLVTLPVCLLALLLSFGIALVIAIAAKRLTGASLPVWVFFATFLIPLAPLNYAALRLVKPDKLITKLLHRR